MQWWPGRSASTQTSLHRRERQQQQQHQLKGSTLSTGVGCTQPGDADLVYLLEIKPWIHVTWLRHQIA
jgi:hypothetical protein